MKLVRYAHGSEEKIGLVKDGGIIDLGKHLKSLPSNMIGLMAVWTEMRDAVAQIEAEAATDLEIARTQILAPISRPGKIMAIGLNYKDHIEESGMPVPQQQTWFSKAPTAINGPFDPIQLPVVSTQLDYEAELVAVIGRKCRHVSKEQAAEVIFGYCAGNDVSVRDWQLNTPQWVLGKSFDTHAPIGPWIVTAGEIGDPHSLGIRCFVNGDLRQNSNTRYLLFNVYDQIAHLTKAMTLEPGDLLFTGTPGGVGLGRKPPTWLAAGDKVRVEIDRIGALVAEVENEKPNSSWAGA